MILPNTDILGAAKMLEGFRLAVQGLRIPHHDSEVGNGYVSISAGIAIFTRGESTSPGQLIRAADENLYRAKDNGRNRVVY